MFKLLISVSILVSAAAYVAAGQVEPLSPLAQEENPAPFAVYHTELGRAADDTLASVVRTMADAGSDNGRNLRMPSPDLLVADFDRVYQTDTRPGVSRAMLRLNQLRTIVDPVLQSEGIPLELASVALVESGGRATALSPKGALGLWQLMPDTARRYGLQVSASKDERLDVEKSTRAAARYLRDLYQQFGSWPLALAGYNTGEQNLQRAVDRGGTSEFLQLSNMRLLPQETRNYVPAVLSVMQLFGKYELPDAPEAGRNTGSSNLIFAVPGATP